MQWRRTVGWSLVVLGILIVTGVVGGLLFLKSTSFQEYALRKIVQAVNDATGCRAEIRNLDFRLSTLTAHLNNITIRGRERLDQPPLLQVDRLTVGFKIQSLAHRKVTLGELLIDHPVVHVGVDREGKSNLPQAPPSQASSHTSVFDLAVGHVLLTDGEINYNDKKTPLDADLYDLGTEIRFDSLATRYSGRISYDTGHLRYANYSPLPHSLTAKFSAAPSGLSLESAEVKVGSSAISLRADMTGYSNPKVEGHYDIRVHTQDFGAMSPALIPAGDISMSGKIHYQGMSGPFLLRNLSTDGQIASEQLAATSSEGRIEIRRLQGRYQLTNGALQAHKLVAEVLGGRVSADIDIEHLDATAVSRIQTSLTGISLQAAEQAIRNSQLKPVALLGRLDGTVDAAWTGSVRNITVRSDLSLRAVASSATQQSVNGVPVDGSIHVTYDGPRNVITFRQTTLRIPATSLAIEGQISNRSNLQIQAITNDLRQLAVLVSAFHAGQPAATAISGSAALNAVIQGSIQKPSFVGQVTASNLQVQGSQWSNAKLALQASSSHIVIQNGSLENARQGKASFRADVGLQNWSYLPSNPIAISLSVQQMAMADLQRLANLQYPVSGDLSAEVSLHGSQLNPTGTGSAKIVNARAYDEPIQKLSVNLHAKNGSITSTLDVGLPAGSANANLSYTPKTMAYNLRLDAPSIVLQKLQIVQAKNLQLAGTLTASATGKGTLDNPQLTTVVELPQLQLRQNSISQIKAEVQVANQRAAVTVSSQASQASVQAHGRVNLTGDYYAEAAIDTTAVPLDPLLAMYVRNLPKDFQVQTEFHATLKGPLKDKSRVEAHLAVPNLNARYQSLQIGAAGPIHADYAHSVVTLQPAEIRGTGTSLSVQGSIPLGGTTTATLIAKGFVDVRVLRIVQPDVQSSGMLSLDVRTFGSAKSPEIQGQVHLQDVALSTASAPIGVENLNGTFDITNDKVRISSLTGQVGGGQVSVGGSIAYRPNLQFNIVLESKAIRLRYPEGLRTLLDSNLAFSGTTQASTLNGRVLIDSLSFTPDFDLAKFSEQFSGSTAPSQPGFADTIKLTIGVQSKEHLSATSSQVSVEGSANLQVIGTAANPVIIGRTNLTSGELFYRNVRYQLQRGIIAFDNPNETELVMNISVTTTVEQYNLTLTLRGSFDKLTTSYVSDPPLATADIINLIARGKTTQEASATSQSTDAMIASQAASQVSGSVQKLAGISALQIDPLIGGNNQNPSARVAVQQRVTKNFLFTFSTDVSQPGNEMVEGDYQINKRWSVSVARDQLGGVSLDGRYHTRF
jgi:translocation and assembly module TamB